MYASRHMPSAVFPQTDFPRVVILINNGAMPADEMMARVTRPIEGGDEGDPRLADDPIVDRPRNG